MMAKKRARHLRLSLRINKELLDKLNILLREYPEQYENISHVFRCAIMRLYVFEIADNGKRRKPLVTYE